MPMGVIGGATTYGKMVNEEPTPVIDGIVKVFYTKYVFVEETLEVTLNGLEITSGIDFVELPGRQSFELMNIPVVGEILRVDYSYVV